jgi:predicted nucleotidyltransferase
MKYGLSNSTLVTLKLMLEGYPEVESAVIFGSRATGNYTPGSDVDIALKGKVSPTLVSRIRAKLNEELPLPYQFDVVDLAGLSNKALRNRIKTTGKVFYQRSVV